jgi:hypothetical protein
MAEEHNHHSGRYIRYALIILAVILIALLVFFVAEYRSLRRAQLINMREGRISQLLQKHAPLPASDATTIRTWMTFDYVNKLFALPPEYLQAQLQITDPHYPRLTIASYAKNTSLNQTTLLGEVEAAVRNYPAPRIVTSTPGASS